MRPILIMTFFCLCMSGTLRAQTRSAGLMIHVMDSVSRSALPGVRIMVVSGRDTVHVVTDGKGEVTYRGVFRTDSVILTAFCIGYQHRQLRVKSPSEGSTVGVYIPLVEEEQEIAEIVVVGKSVAVVMKGDTVQFNAAAFKTFTNDPMSRLFDILPGMKLENGQLTYLGEMIHRITIDGQRLFGGHVGLALEHIRADDVVDVRVYREESDWDKLNEIENPALQTVADVRTKSKPSMIRQTEVSVGAGAAIDPVFAELGGRETLYEGFGNLMSSRVGKTVSVRTEVSTQPTAMGDPAVMIVATSPNKRYAAKGGDLLYSGEQVNKFKYSTRNRVNLTNRTNEQWIHWAYFPTMDYSSRDYDNHMISNSIIKSLSSNNELQFTLRDKSIVGGRLDASYRDETTDQLSIRTATRDGVILQQQDISQGRQGSPYSLTGRIESMKRAGPVKLNASVAAKIYNHEADGWRMDTLSSSTSQIYLANPSAAWDRRYWGRLSADIMLSPIFSLSLSDYLEHTHRRSRRISVDMLTGLVDLTNSYDYLVHELDNTLEVSANYRDNNKKTGLANAQIGVSWVHRDMLRDDRFPKTTNLPRKFDLMNTNMSLEYKSSAFNGVKIAYKRYPTSISLMDFRELDDSNPMMLSAGNPHLRIPILNSFTTTGNFIKGPSTYELKIEYQIVENTTVSRTRYFIQDTYLPEYDYTAKAGSTLSKRENRNGQWSFGISGDYNLRSRKLQSHIRLGSSYRHAVTPAYVNDHLTGIVADAYRASLLLIGNFSSVFMPSLGSVTTYHDRTNGYVRNRWLTQSLEGELRVMVSDAVELNNSNSFNWNLQWPDIPGMDHFGVVSNLSLGYLFDPQGNFRLSAQVNDLLNRKQRVLASVNQEFVQTQYTHTMGRYFLIRVSYKF